MTIPRAFIDSVLTKIDIVDLINTHVPLRKKSGSNYFARCPFHNEKNPSFSVSQTKQFFYCFGCGARGNAFDFLMQYEHLNFPEAVESLAKQIGMEVPKQVGSKKNQENDSLTSLYDYLVKVSDHYYQQMRQSTRAIDYLKKRGISGKIAQAFNLGYAPPSYHHVLDTFGKTEADKKKLLETGLIFKKDNGGYGDRFRDRILFPIHDYRGRIIGFGGRILDQGEPKYLNSPETPLFQKGHELYGLYHALKANRKLDRLLVVEGYMDVIALFQHGITYAVATLGTATTAHHLKRLFRYTMEIVFCFDGDEAGRKAAWRALQVIFPLMHDDLEIRFLFLPEGDDPDTLIRREGKAAFEDRMLSAHTLSTFFFQTISHQGDLETMEGRARFGAAALSHIKALPEGLFHTIMMSELAKRARITIKELETQLNRHPAPHLVNLVRTPSDPDLALPQPLRLVLALLIQYPHLTTLIRDPLPPLNLPGYDFLTALIEVIRLNPHLNSGGLIEYWRGKEEETWIARLAHLEHNIPEIGIENEFLGAIRQLTSLSYDEEINRLMAKAAKAGLSNEEKRALSNWINQKKQLAGQSS